MLGLAKGLGVATGAKGLTKGAAGLASTGAVGCDSILALDTVAGAGAGCLVAKEEGGPIISGIEGAAGIEGGANILALETVAGARVGAGVGAGVGAAASFVASDLFLIMPLSLSIPVVTLSLTPVATLDTCLPMLEKILSCPSGGLKPLAIVLYKFLDASMILLDASGT